MDADIDIARSLDIIAEEMSGKDEKTDLPFEIIYQKEDNQDISDTTSVTLRQAVRMWSNTQDFNKRIFSIARCLVKNGDCFFRKLSDTKKWVYVDPTLIHGIEIDQLGNRIAYHIKKPTNTVQYGIKMEQHEVVPAAAIIHFTLSDDMGDSAPFGVSVLRPIHRVYKQLSMLEDAVIIYRIVRAPERRVFYIDVGNMPPQRVKKYLEEVKNEIRQKRVPGQNGGKDIVDGQYDAQCLALDTQVPLLDGRTLTLAELIEEHEAGKQNWVFSCHPVTGQLSPGEITWAGVTRKQAEVVRVHFDNGEVVTCTPDHRFPVQGIGFIQAQHLTADMSLVPFNRRWVSGEKIDTVPFYTGYEEVFDVSKKKWVKTHQLVANTVELAQLEHRLIEKKVVVHHVDFNKHNNAPENLVMMGLRDHMLYHADHNKARFKNWSPEQQARHLAALHAGQVRKMNGDAEAIIKRAERLSEAHQLNPDWGVRKAVKKTAVRPELEDRWLARNQNQTWLTAVRAQLAVLRAQQWTTVTPVMLSRVIELGKQLATALCLTKLALRSALENDVTFMTELRANNPTKGASNRYKVVSDKLIANIIKRDLGFKTWSHFKADCVNTNHKITYVERVIERQDTGCLTVGERYHKNHTFALAVGVFCANSLQEDIYMPVTAAGRGSRVETLPGGTEDFGTGLIKLFQDKIFRGLRIPTSYMTGQDGAQAQYNDGKVGIAYIEELRFAQFIRRLQDRLDEVFDQEFKIYLKVVGLKIDDEVFKIKLPDPANFALYRQAALDADLIGSYNNISADKTLSRRFILKRYLGLTDDEIQMNEAMIKEERGILENANVSALQQIYDDAVYGNREAITVEAAAVEPEGGGESFGGEEAGEPGFFAGGEEEAAPPEEAPTAPPPEAAPAEETPPPAT